MQNELTAERIEMAIAYWAEFYQEIGEMQNGLSGGQYELLEEQREPVITALAALRAEQERNKGCMYCVGFGISSATVKSDFGFSEKMKRINICPYCGRRLTEGGESK